MKKLLVTSTIIALASFSFAATATLSLDKSNDNNFQLTIDSDSDIYGLQLDLTYDESQLKLSEEDINHMFTIGDMRSGMSVYSKIKSPGLARVVMFDISGNAILTSGNVEKVLSFGYDLLNSTSSNLSLTIDNIVLAGLHGEEVTTNSSQVFDFDMSESTLPFETNVKGNYPNPFNPVTTIEFDLSEMNSGLINITVYDIQGRKVAEIFDGYLEAGFGYKFNWDASSVSSGKYFAQITAPGFADTINMTLLK